MDFIESPARGPVRMSGAATVVVTGGTAPGESVRYRKRRDILGLRTMATLSSATLVPGEFALS